MHQKYNYKVGGLGHEPITPFDRYGRLLLCGGNPASVHTPLLLPYAFHGPLVMPVFVLIDGGGGASPTGTSTFTESQQKFKSKFVSCS
jgi:hypothetical protein